MRSLPAVRSNAAGVAAVLAAIAFAAAPAAVAGLSIDGAVAAVVAAGLLLPFDSLSRRQDHHCVWVDNCVASGNMRQFWCFLMSLSLCILESYVLTALYAAQAIGKPSQWVRIRV